MLASIQALIDDQRKTLKLFALGGLLFFLGLGFIQWASHTIEPSLQQESVVLAGAMLAGCGFLISMTAQVFLIIHRFQKMGKRR